MCHAVHSQQAEPGPRSSAAPPFAGRLRPRWVAIAGAALVGTFALAFVSPSPEPPLPDLQASVPVTPVAAKSGAVPAGGEVELGAGIDDGVPTTTGKDKAGLGNCSHGL